MRIAIAGGTGTVGGEAVRELERRGHEVRVLSRHAPEYPVDLSDGSGLAAALAETAEAEPLTAITQFAGPEVLSGCELARRWRRRTGSRALSVRLPVTRALRSGALTNPHARRGSVTFDTWLEAA